MRKSIWIPSFIILLTCLLLLFKGRHQTVSLSQLNVIGTNQIRPSFVPSLQLSNSRKIVRARPLEDITNVVLVETSPGKSNAINAGLLSKWQAPIAFYGEVIDENSNLIADASIHFEWYEIPSENAKKTNDTKSDSQRAIFIT